jgi:DNA-binding IclR family transcriptional regulator
MSSLDRLLSLLTFFGERQLSLTIAEAERLTGASRSSVYRYVRSLADAGLLAPSADGSYVLGPRVMELERLMREHDPLLLAARPIIRRQAEQAGLNIMLCSYYGSRVLCADHAWPDTSVPEIYQRGRSMPIFSGAMAKAILAHLPARQQRAIYSRNQEEARVSGLAISWHEFRSEMARIRRAGIAVTHGEVVPGLVGLAAPLRDTAKRVLGSVVLVIGADRFSRMNEATLTALLLSAAAEIDAALIVTAELLDGQLTPPRRTHRSLT